MGDDEYPNIPEIPWEDEGDEDGDDNECHLI